MTGDTPTPALVPGRSCDGCTMCCKLMRIAEIGKPRAVWCRHCNPRTGCRIYDDRPAECRDFYCGWRRSEGLGDDWKPSRSRIIVSQSDASGTIVIHVDPDRADAWRTEPFWGRIKQWARHLVPQQGRVIVCVGERTFAVLPDREKELGSLGPEHFIVPIVRPGPFGPHYDVEVRTGAPANLASAPAPAPQSTTVTETSTLPRVACE